MRVFARFTDNGDPAGFWNEADHGYKERAVYGEPPIISGEDEELSYGPAPIVGTEPNPDCRIPLDAIEITHEQWDEFVSNPARRRMIDGVVTAYEPPPPPSIVPATISDRQFFQQLSVEGIISQTEALAAVKTGAIPEALQNLIDAMPEPERFGAEMIVSGGTTFERAHPLTIAIGAAYGMSATDIDDFFVAAAAL